MKKQIQRKKLILNKLTIANLKHFRGGHCIPTEPTAGGSEDGVCDGDIKESLDPGHTNCQIAF